MPGFGPLGARAATVRPTKDTDTYLVQTWFKDCSAPGANDGTVPTASWFNHLVGNLVYAAGQASVPLTNDQADDTFIWDIIDAAIAAALPPQDAVWGLGIVPATHGVAAATDGDYPNPTVVTSATHAMLATLSALGFISYTQSATQPVGPALNSIWYKPDTGLAAGGAPANNATLKRWNGSEYETVTPALIATYWAHVWGGPSVDGSTILGDGLTTPLSVVTSALDLFGSGNAGIVPASGGGAVNFLRADGVWAAPGGGGGSISDGDYGDISVASGVWTIDSGAVSKEKMANAAAFTLMGNASGSSATPADIDISTLSDIGQPVAGDYIPIRDASAAGALKRLDAGKFAKNQMAAHTIRGNPTGSAANGADIDIDALDEISSLASSDVLLAKQASTGALKKVSAGIVGQGIIDGGSTPWTVAGAVFTVGITRGGSKAPDFTLGATIVASGAYSIKAITGASGGDAADASGVILTSGSYRVVCLTGILSAGPQETEYEDELHYLVQTVVPSS